MIYAPITPDDVRKYVGKDSRALSQVKGSMLLDEIRFRADEAGQEYRHELFSMVRTLADEIEEGLDI